VAGPGAPPDWKSKIVSAEARRDAGDPAIPIALQSADPELRRAALWALGRIEEVGTASIAAPFVMDADPKVAAAAAFALGQIQGPTAVKALQDALPHGRAPVAVMRALARAGTASVAEALSARLGDKEPSVRAAAALSLGLLKKRLPAVPSTWSPKLVQLLADPEGPVRFAAAYALARFADADAAVGLVRALSDPDPEVRMWAATGLGKAGAHPGVFDAVMRDPDWRVQAAAAAGLGATAKANPTDVSRAMTRVSALASAAFARVAGEDRLAAGRALHVVRACVRAARSVGAPGRKLLEQLEQATWKTKDLPASASLDLSRVQCDAAEALDHLDKAIKRVLTCGQGTFVEWRRRELWLQLTAEQAGPNAVAEIGPYTLNPDPKLRAAAMTALGTLITPESTELLLARLDSNDLVVAATAFEILVRPDRADLRPDALAERLMGTLERLLAQPDDSLIVGALDGLGHLGEEAKPLMGRLRALGSDPRPAVRRRAARVRQLLSHNAVSFGPGSGAKNPPPRPAPTELVLETVRGTVVLGLQGGKAPRFTGVLSSLAQAGYYNGLTVHRVVSGFVTQGGCPRGDGWGGPGFTVAGETSPEPFERGAIGIATNGRDTGGSQFFVMHAYHPHLDGNYPWVGRVVQGIDVVDALQPDDVIRSVIVRPGSR